MVKILDCTLRDGGYYNNWNYPRKTLEEYFKHLNNLPVSFAEIGYRSTRKDRYLGELFYTPDYILRKAAELIPSIQKAIMLDEKDVTVRDLHALLTTCKGLVHMIRIAVSPDRLDNGLELAREAGNMGFSTALNVMYASKWLSDEQLMDKIKRDVKDISYFYLVDSFGALYPHQVKDLIHKLKPDLVVPLGFHGHNNLELALINSLTAIEHGCEIIDSTVAGMGRGAGNLKTELLLIALKEKELYNLDFDSLSCLTELFEGLRKKYEWGTNIAYMLAGAYSIPQKEVMEQMNKQRYFIGNIIGGWGKYVSGDTFSKSQEVPLLSGNRPSDEIIITGGGPSVSDYQEAFKHFVEMQYAANISTGIIHSSTRFASVFNKEYAGLQYFCLFGKEGKRLESFPESAEIIRNDRFIIPCLSVTQGTYIPAGMADNIYQSSEISFASQFSDSPLALAIQSAIDLKARKIYLYGFDGYLVQENQAQFDLFNENQQIIDKALEHGIQLISLTPTRYRNLKEVSIFRIITKFPL